MKAEATLPPGATVRHRMPMLICRRCWIPGEAWGDVWILEPPGRDLIVKCEDCGGRDTEVTGYGINLEAAARIADWNAMIDRRIERRKHDLS